MTVLIPTLVIASILAAMHIAARLLQPEPPTPLANLPLYDAAAVVLSAGLADEVEEWLAGGAG